MVQLLVIIAALLFFVQVIYLTTKNKLTDQQAFIWILFSLGGVILAFALPWLNTISIDMGIAYPPALIMLVAFLIVLTFSVYHTTLISKQDEKVKILIQEVAFLQKRVERFERRETTRMNPMHFFLILLNTLVLVGGQFLFKMGMMKQTASFSSVGEIIKMMFSPFILSGLTLYGFATVLWLFILTKVPLSIAYPIQSLAYVFAIFGAFFLFDEPLGWWKIAGVLFIMIGVAFIGLGGQAQ